jgi:hypothetical protein
MSNFPGNFPGQTEITFSIRFNEHIEAIKYNNKSGHCHDVFDSYVFHSLQSTLEILDIQEKASRFIK